MIKGKFVDQPLDIPIKDSLAMQAIIEMTDDGIYPSIFKTNVPHLVVHHSPAGFSFGYAGSGPADLALNVCEWMLRNSKFGGKKVKCHQGSCFSMALSLHQEFKNTFIAISSLTDGELHTFPMKDLLVWKDQAVHRYWLTHE